MTDKQAISEGDVSFLYRKYRTGLMSFICQQGVFYREAEDVMQNTFIRVWKYMDTYDEDGGASVKTWLFTIAKNVARIHYRKKKAQRRIPCGLLVSIQAIADDPDERALGLISGSQPDIEIERKEERAILEKILSEMPHYGEILMYRDLKDYTYEEIQQITGLPMGTIKSRIHRGRKKLQKYVA